MRRLVSTPDDEALTIKLFDDTTVYRWKLHVDLFGTTEVKKMCVSKIKLCPARRTELKSSKIKSLKKKYIAIPEEHKSFYPNFDNVSSADEEIIPKKSKRKRKRKSKVPEKKKTCG